MAVQLLEDWLLKEQEKMQIKYRELNQVSSQEPDIIFIGDSIIEYYPIHELLQTQKQLINRGIRGYKTDLLRANLDAHVFGTAVDKVFLMIGTNDIGKEIPQEETLRNIEEIIQTLHRDFPLTQVKLISVLPVNEGEIYKGTVYIRTNEKIKNLNQSYAHLAQSYLNVDFIDVFTCMLDTQGQLREDFTTDGLHLTIAGYQVLSDFLQEYL